MSASVAELDRWIEGLRQGKQDVTADFWHHYAPLLERLAEKNLAPGMKGRLGADDVVQSVCRTFFRRAKEGQFQLNDQDNLWRLLVAITLTKIREKTRFHMRDKRGVQREQRLAAGEDSPGPALPSAAPTPAELAEFADLLEGTLSGLDDEERQVVQLKLQEFTHEEVAEKIGCSERTVRRILKKVQARLEKMLE